MNTPIRTPEGSARGEDGGAVEASALDRAPLEPPYQRVDLDRYVVLNDGPVGYVEAVPPVFVCYVGHPYAHACEIAQVHDFHRAVDAVVETAVSSRAPKITA